MNYVELRLETQNYKTHINFDRFDVYTVEIEGGEKCQYGIAQLTRKCFVVFKYIARIEQYNAIDMFDTYPDALYYLKKLK